jgi:hypothetical protein
VTLRPETPSLISEIAWSTASFVSRCHSATSSGTWPITNVRVMSQYMADRLSRGQMSITTGTPASIWPEPMS